MKEIRMCRQSIFRGWIIFLFISSSCTPLLEEVIDENGVVISKPYIWRTELGLANNQSSSDNSIGGEFDKAVIHEGKMLFAGNEDSQGILENGHIAALDIETGDIIWKWNDFIEPDYAARLDTYYYEHYFSMRIGSRRYVIDLRDGNTLWKEKGDMLFRHNPYGIGYLHFGNGKYYETSEQGQEIRFERGYVCRIDRQDAPNFFLEPPYDKRFPYGFYNSIGKIQDMIPLLTPNDILIVVYYTNYVEENKRNSYLGLYNFTKRRWIYNQVFIGDGGGGVAEVSNDKVYSINEKKIKCHKLETGEKLWETNISKQAGGVDVILAERKLIGISSDSFLYGIDIESGRIEYEKVLANSGPLNYHNGIVYFVGLGDLYALEASTGKVLWQIESPDLELSRFYSFKSDQVGIVEDKNGGKAKILVSSYKSAFCYEAIR